MEAFQNTLSDRLERAHELMVSAGQRRMTSGTAAQLAALQVRYKRNAVIAQTIMGSRAFGGG